MDNFSCSVHYSGAPNTAVNTNRCKQSKLFVTQKLNRLQQIQRTLNISTAYVDDALDRLENQQLSLIVVGEFKKGKSTFINALLGQPVLPSDILPTTATINRVKFGAVPSVTICFKGGKKHKISTEQLAAYVTKLTANAEAQSSAIQEAILHYPLALCQHGVEIIDTPGLNDDDEMTAVTLSALHPTQIAIMVTSAIAPFAESESLFLTETLLARGIRQFIFVVNGIDYFKQSHDVDRVQASIEGRIQKSIKDWAAQEYGEETPLYNECLARIGPLNIYGISAQQALLAKQTGDRTLLEQSRFAEFERSLSTLLAQKRQMLLLQVSADTLSAGTQQALKALETLRGKAIADHHDSVAVSTRVMAQLSEVRSQIRATFKEIEQSVQRLGVEVESQAADLADQLMVKAAEIIDDVLEKSTQKNNPQQQSLAQQMTSALLLHCAKVESQITAQVKTSAAQQRQRIKTAVKTFNQQVLALQRQCHRLEAPHDHEIFSAYPYSDVTISIRPLYDLVDIDPSALHNQLPSPSELSIYAAAGATVGTFLGGPIGTVVGGAIASGYERNRRAQTLKKCKPQALESVKAQIDSRQIKQRADWYITAEVQTIADAVSIVKHQLEAAINEAEREFSAVQGFQSAKVETSQKCFNEIAAELEEIMQAAP